MDSVKAAVKQLRSDAESPRRGDFMRGGRRPRPLSLSISFKIALYRILRDYPRTL